MAEKSGLHKLPLRIVLSEEQSMALGQIAAQWSYLESEIAQHYELTARLHGRVYEAAVEDKDFISRLRAWRELVEDISISDKDRQATMALIGKIGNLSQLRHKPVHARWGLDQKERLVAFSDRGARQFDWKVSTDKLWDIALRISRVNVELGMLQIPKEVGTT